MRTTLHSRQTSNRFDTGIPPVRPHWPRKSLRENLHAEVVCRRSGRPGYQVQLFDISPHGCKIEFVEKPKLDDRIWIKFSGLEALPAYVCWIEGFIAGVEFDKTIHPAVFERLLTQLR